MTRQRQHLIEYLLRLIHKPMRTGTMIVPLILALLLAGCAAEDGGANTSALNTPPAPTATPEATREVAAAITQTAEPTPEGPTKLVIWWPEPLAPLDNETAAEVLSEQISAFQRANQNVVVDFRLKKVDDVGGIMSTLRTGSAVAPGALPDLTLVRRDDLLIAAQAGLIQPLSERLAPAVLEDVQGAALDLGRSSEQLYGLPYTLEIQHIAYPPTTPQVANWTFQDVLDAKVPFLFPAGRTNMVNDVLLLQYLAAGGTWSDAGDISIDADALRSTLHFYEQASAEGIVSPDVLEYASSDDYQQMLVDGTPAAGVVTSTTYLQLVDDGVTLGVGPIPTETGAPVTLLDGWMWVLTTSDADRQTRALEFLYWMQDAERQQQYTDVLHMLPSQRTAMRQLDDSQYADFVSELMSNAILPLTESESGAATRAMQNALASVLTGQRTSPEATLDVIDQFGG
jgi:ABC-type glycerol-3-phosphate transport system substrate-binding protein